MSTFGPVYNSLKVLFEAAQTDYSDSAIVYGNSMIRIANERIAQQIAEIKASEAALRGYIKR
jgi:hypothetical protein